ncbi:agmatine/peptidylarginine deiminase [Arthrobacter sp. JSM 101049]|uniref:agmatine deiminase family protein n=1 Tax=Arthrobacter sp. JSM 101049 TaxID=929097 RepID=UPI00356211E3
MSWTMPAETSAQDRVWMAFPSSGYTLGETETDAEAARACWAAVARATARFAPVTLVVDPSSREAARRHLGNAGNHSTGNHSAGHGVDLVELPLDDAWMRDIGPTFVHDDDGGLAAVDWVFNGWGQQDWANWEHDARIAGAVASLAGVPRIASSLVNEGGGFHVDGIGTALATETVQLDPYRNPGATKADVEAEFSRLLGVGKVIWLPRGLARDNGEFGTRGHVDIVATFPEPGVVLYHDQRDPSHPDHALSAELAGLFAAATDAAGHPLRAVPVPAPATLHDDEGWVDYSYLNHLVVNGGVIACTFADRHDDEALAVLSAAYPGREVVGVDARELFARGGGIHCITQQQPTPRRQP